MPQINITGKVGGRSAGGGSSKAGGQAPTNALGLTPDELATLKQSIKNVNYVKTVQKKYAEISGKDSLAAAKALKQANATQVEELNEYNRKQALLYKESIAQAEKNQSPLQKVTRKQVTSLLGQINAGDKASKADIRFKNTTSRNEASLQRAQQYVWAIRHRYLQGEANSENRRLDFLRRGFKERYSLLGRVAAWGQSGGVGPYGYGTANGGGVRGAIGVGAERLMSGIGIARGLMSGVGMIGAGVGAAALGPLYGAKMMFGAVGSQLEPDYSL